MFITSAAEVRRSARASRAALLGLALLAACDTDEPVAPSSVKVPDAAQPAVIPIRTGAVRITTVDEGGTLLPVNTLQYRVTDSQNISVDVWDNGQKDSDPKVAVITLVGLNPGTYTVCQVSGPTGYLPSKPLCVAVTLPAGKVTDAPVFVMPRVPFVSISATDPFNKLLGGAGFIIKDSLGKGINVVTDNLNFVDLDNALGKLKIQLPDQGKYSVCVNKNPPAYWMPAAEPQPYCKSFQVAYGQTAIVPAFVFVYPYSGRWGVTDGGIDANNNPTLIGPAGFEVYNPMTKTWIHIDDNGFNDEDPTLGKISMPLLNGGSFSVCEVTPPVNHWNAQPNCKTLTIPGAASPGWAGWFLNPEKQVIYIP